MESIMDRVAVGPIIFTPNDTSGGHVTVEMHLSGTRQTDLYDPEGGKPTFALPVRNWEQFQKEARAGSQKD